MSEKVFCINAHKNATTSLGLALVKLGFKFCPQKVSYKYVNCKEDLALHLTDEYDAFCDSPWCHVDFYQTLYRKHPTARFILTTRPADEWAESYFRFIKAFGGWQRFPLRDLFIKLYGAPGLVENKQIMMLRYEARNEAIKIFFKERPDAKFLEVSAKELSYKTLCDFLAIDKVPTAPFPIANVTKK